MQVVLIGLGRMGANMARRWARGGVNVVAFDQSGGACCRNGDWNSPGSDCGGTGALLTAASRELSGSCPAGEVTETTIAALLPQLAKGTCWLTAATPITRTHCAVR